MDLFSRQTKHSVSFCRIGLSILYLDLTALINHLTFQAMHSALRASSLVDEAEDLEAKNLQSASGPPQAASLHPPPSSYLSPPPILGGLDASESLSPSRSRSRQSSRLSSVPEGEATKSEAEEGEQEAPQG